MLGSTIVIIFWSNKLITLLTHRCIARTMAPTFLFFLAFLLPPSSVSTAVDVSTLDIHTVPCNSMTASCECWQNADVCVFRLSIQIFNSFTRYYIDPNFGELIQLGRAYYFGEDGNLYGHTGPRHPFCGNFTESPLDTCTPVYTFDGSTFKSFIGVNGQVPGPALIV